MGRHRTQEEKRELGERARAMRAAGRSRREIQEELGIGDDLLTALLVGTEVPGALRRPRAKDDLRAVARELRAAGRLREGADPDRVAASIIALWDGIQLQWLLENDAVDMVACLTDYLDLMILPAP